VSWLLAAAVLVGTFMIIATALPLLRKGAWWIRMFDFPRLQITVISAVTLAVLLAAGDRSSAWQNIFAALLALALAYQAYMMFPYTVVARRQVEDARRAGDDNTIALLFANVLMTNRSSQALLAIIREEEPDIVLAVEADAWWQRELDVLAQTHRYAVRKPQDNTYGMLIYSRLELMEPQIKFLV
jgi:endonuclease/exonuclease/phosphatase (EEP) superfamily protein YafD